MSKKILVPIDLQHESSWKYTLPPAVARTQQADDVHVTVMTVVPDIRAGLDYRYAIRGEMEGSGAYDMQQMVNDALEQMEKIVRDYVPENVTVETIARHGTIYEQILDVAEEIGATEIIIAANRPSLRHYLLGPNTDLVVRHAKCNVTVVRNF